MHGWLQKHLALALVRQARALLRYSNFDLPTRSLTGDSKHSWLAHKTKQT